MYLAHFFVLSQAATCYFKPNHLKIEATPLSDLPAYLCTFPLLLSINQENCELEFFGLARQGNRTLIYEADALAISPNAGVNFLLLETTNQIIVGYGHWA